MGQVLALLTCREEVCVKFACSNHVLVLFLDSLVSSQLKNMTLFN